MISPPLTPIEIGLTAAIVTVEGYEPAILLAGDRGKPRAGLPFGPRRLTSSTTISFHCLATGASFTVPRTRAATRGPLGGVSPAALIARAVARSTTKSSRPVSPPVGR